GHSYVVVIIRIPSGRHALLASDLSSLLLTRPKPETAWPNRDERLPPNRAASRASACLLSKRAFTTILLTSCSREQRRCLKRLARYSIRSACRARSKSPLQLP